jgi:hypothetical protein
MVKIEEILDSIKGIEKIEDINDNAAAIGLLSAAIIATLSNIFKLMAYSYYSGWFDYFQINKDYINIANENIFYDIAISISTGLIFFAFNYIVYRAINNKDKKTFFFAYIFIAIFNVIYLFLFTDYIQNINKFSFNNLLAIVISCFILLPIIELILGISWRVIYLIKIKKVNNKNTKMDVYEKSKNDFTVRQWIIGIIITIIIYIPFSYWFGNYNAQIIKDFKTINNKYVVIYETESEYLIANCNINFNDNLLEINKNKQTYISKINMETEKMRFKSVKLN